MNATNRFYVTAHPAKRPTEYRVIDDATGKTVQRYQWGDAPDVALYLANLTRDDMNAGAE